MAITELIFPALKPTKEVIDEVEEKWPTLSNALVNPNPGLLSAFRGWVISENGKDVRDQYREVLLFEWVEETAFHSFVASDQFASFAKLIKHLVSGPPTLQLYNTDISPKDVAAAPVVEIFRLNVSNSERVQEAQDNWKVFSQTQTSIEGQKGPSVVYGQSLNLEGDVVVGILGWASTEDWENGIKGVALQAMLDSLRLLGELSQIVIDVDLLELPAL